MSATNTDILRTLQRHGRNVQADRDNLIEELLVLAQYLHVNPTPEGAGRGALGGIQYLVKRLHEQFECQMSLEQLAERYVEAELGSYAHSTDDVEATRAWARSQGLVVRSIPVSCPDGNVRYIHASHLNQTSMDGKTYVEGEFMHNHTRFPPPFAALLKGTPYDRSSR